MPESMELLVRTKIKGSTVESSDDIKAPNLYELPPLPAYDKQPPDDVLDEMRKAILKIGPSISHFDRDLTMSPTVMHRQVTDHRTVSPTSTSACEVCMDFNLEEPFMLPPPRSPTSDKSESGSLVRFHQPLQAQIGQSTADSLEGIHQQVHSHSHTHTPRAKSNEVYFSPDILHEDFEPLPFWVDNDSFLDDDDFANFIEGAIHQVEG